MGHWRPLFTRANINVHASFEGVYDRLGLDPDNLAYLAGPRKFGLQEPGRNTAHAITLLTSALLLSREDETSVVNSSALIELMQEVADAFDMVALPEI